MEFYATARVPAPASLLQRHVTIANLARLCASIERVLVAEGERGEIDCAWGRFPVARQVLRYGVRFSLPGCENALQWSVTAARQEVGCVLVHLTLNGRAYRPEFVGQLRRFVEDWRQGLEEVLPQVRAAAVPKPGGPCTPWFG